MAVALSAVSSKVEAEPERPSLRPGFEASQGSAQPFVLVADEATRARATSCLASAIYYEAANQSLQGRRAVAQVVLNRLRHAAFPKSVCGVIYQGASRRGCQFTFACDGSLERAPDPRGWQAAADIAQQALNGFVEPSVGGSTHYHTLWVHPAWDGAMLATIRIGAHQFYRMAGPSGAAAALDGAYAGSEPMVAALQGAALPSRLQAARPVARPTDMTFMAWGLSIARVSTDGDSVRVVTDLDPARTLARAPGVGAATTGF